MSLVSQPAAAHPAVAATPPPPDLATSPMVFRQARLKAVLVSLCSAAISVGGALMVVSPRPAHEGYDRVIGALAAVAFGGCTLLFLLMLLRPAELAISPTGVRLCILFRAEAWSWKELSNFRLKTMGRATTIECDGPGKFSRLNQAFGFSGPKPVKLGALWDADPQYLVNLLNSAKERWG